MDCKRARELLFLIVDNELGSDVTQDLDEHLSGCPLCADRGVYARRFVAVVRQRCGRRTAPQRLRLRILGSFEHRRADT